MLSDMYSVPSIFNSKKAELARQRCRRSPLRRLQELRPADQLSHGGLEGQRDAAFGAGYKLVTVFIFISLSLVLENFCEFIEPNW